MEMYRNKNWKRMKYMNKLKYGNKIVKILRIITIN